MIDKFFKINTSIQMNKGLPMFSIKDVPERIVILKLESSEDIIGNLFLCPSDLTHGTFKRSKIINPITNKECLVISNPVRHLNQVDISTGNIHIMLVTWTPQSFSKLYMVPLEMIVDLIIPNDRSTKDYQNFLKNFEKNLKIEKRRQDEDPTAVKILCPPAPEVH